MGKPKTFTKVQQAEQKKKKKLVMAGTITDEDYSKFLDEELLKGEMNWKRYTT